MSRPLVFVREPKSGLTSLLDPASLEFFNSFLRIGGGVTARRIQSADMDDLLEEQLREAAKHAASQM